MFHLVHHTTVPTVLSNTLALDWNSWPTGALLHRSPSRPLSYLNYPDIEGKWPHTCPEGDIATWVEYGRRGQCPKQSNNCVLSMKGIKMVGLKWLHFPSSPLLPGYEQCYSLCTRWLLAYPNRGHLWSGRTGSCLQMNRSSLRNNRLKFKTTWKLPIILEEFHRIYPNLLKENRRMSTCNRLDLQTLGSQPVMPKNLPDHWRQLLSS